MRITLIHNPNAGDAKHGEKQLMAALAKAGHHATYQSTKERGLKRTLKQPTDLVLAAGGDGTTAKVAARLVDSGIPMSVIPLGTANNLARALGFLASPEEIIARLEGGKKRAFDVGLAHGPWGKRYFFEAAGGGLLADYVRAAKKEGKKNGKLKKLSKEQEMARHSALLRRMLHDYPACQWKIEIDGKDISGRYILWGSNEHSLRWSRAASGATRRDQGWTIRFCLRTPGRFRAFGETLRCTRIWEEEQFSAAGAKIP
jgi:diacylglycerol kinase (ATP)